MSCTTIYLFGPDGEVTQTAEFKNAYGGAMAVWGVLGRKYLTLRERVPDLPEHRYDNPEALKYLDSAINYADKVWPLADDDRLLPCERIVLKTTFDNAAVKGEDLPALVEAFEEFARIHQPWFDTNQQVFSIGRQGAILRTLLEREDVRAVAWQQTSVSGVAWSGRYNEETDEEIPYNIDTMDTHWFIPMA